MFDEFLFGWGWVMYFWLFLVVILLFSVGGMFFVYEGVYKFSYFELLKWLWLVLGVLVFGIVVEGILMCGCM